MIYLLIGGILIIGGVVLYFIEKRKKKISPEKENINKDKFTETLPKDKFEELETGDFVEFSPDLSSVPMKEYQITGTGVLQGLSGVERNFAPNNDLHCLFVLGNGDYLLIKFNDGEWVAFNQKIHLVGESAKEFNSYGETFSKGGQVPDSVNFVWRDMNLSIKDVGYLEYQPQSGICEIPDGAQIKFMLAERDDGAIFFLENRKIGPGCVRIGHDLGYNLDQYLGRITKNN
jgi:hypothetical protein